ncbi:Ty3/gypsy retrotransposon protein [Quillaja saponaria]|uniref:Ty3/gypsy retrotransposon protein n=1 Tax=Quillaja saponaria TaxID=32244 RepID=A0AAD7L0J5_QUISA|nr:Ty3/gypsy retrotransposon protein [Quillaja saponaria]
MMEELRRVMENQNRNGEPIHGMDGVQRGNGPPFGGRAQEMPNPWGYSGIGGGGYGGNPIPEVQNGGGGFPGGYVPEVPNVGAPRMFGYEARPGMAKGQLFQQARYARMECPRYGLLQSLPIPDKVWTDIAIDFIQGLPKTEVEAVDRSLVAREEMLRLLKFHLSRAQTRMKAFVDSHRIDKEFQVGDSVYLKLQPYRQFTIASRVNIKLHHRFLGPYVIVRRVGSASYELKLPIGAKIHPVFYISKLKAAIGDQHASSSLPECDYDGLLRLEPLVVLDRTTIRRGNKDVTQVLVKQSTSFVEDSTKENWITLH